MIDFYLSVVHPSCVPNPKSGFVDQRRERSIAMRVDSFEIHESGGLWIFIEENDWQAFVPSGAISHWAAKGASGQ